MPARTDLRAGRVAVVLLATAVLGAGCVEQAPDDLLDVRFDQVVELPEPDVRGDVPLERTLAERRSGRAFDPEPLAAPTLGQLLWAGQGITDDRGYRTAPSAGARHPLELYVVTAAEISHYLPEGHRLESRADPTALAELGEATFDQPFVASAAAVIVVVGVPARTAAEYGDLAEAFVEREVGHATQNVLLQATALGLSAVPVGGFDPDRVARVLALPPGREVYYLVPVGRPA